ncbi:hypothetical protein O7627_20930 [Solwaraspora sp. WMMD1047]|uniref:hypothetical protein n=1 Tax=Solwaraspora sp. WMMD1047 TaxID=3016102 RepID=UPI002417705B|nr:hypothetical protein [Solwaraspora sp. WMMD1047]MDG4831749.1 hypothetical protein [Solwaraspora sp. WMMD1047]
MLFRSEILDGIRAGRISVAFRRWRQARVRPGSRIRTAVGIVEVRSVHEASLDAISEDEARQAGYPSTDALRADLPDRDDLLLFRIGIGYAGSDPRVILRDQDQLSPDEFALIATRLARLDGSTARGRWTRRVLAAIAAHPGRRAVELTELAGYPATEVFKRDVRKLKELGLTESLDVGYRLSPRGRAVVELLGWPDPPQPGAVADLGVGRRVTDP